jgi:penicillin-binding protein 2
VVIDLADGAIVAIASHSDDEMHHAVCSIRPGSVFKLVTALAILESGVPTGDTVLCQRRGPLPGGGRYVCDEEHGTISFADAFAHSCNAYFETMAQRVGRDAMLRACHELGLDANPDIGLPGTPCGLHPRWGDGAKWWDPDLPRISIGQGKALVSPLQVVIAYARIAAGGRMLEPYLVADRSPRSIPVDPSLAQFSPLLRDAARRVVEYGTGKNVRELREIDAAGKSGTGDLYGEHKGATRDPTRSDKLNNTWFVAFAPSSNPRYAAVVVYESVEGFGATNAGPGAARLLAEALK